MFLHLSVILSTGEGGRSENPLVDKDLPLDRDSPPDRNPLPPEQRSPSRQTPQVLTSSGSHCNCQYASCILVFLANLEE